MVGVVEEDFGVWGWPCFSLMVFLNSWSECLSFVIKLLQKIFGCGKDLCNPLKFPQVIFKPVFPKIRPIISPILISRIPKYFLSQLGIKYS